MRENFHMPAIINKPNSNAILGRNFAVDRESVVVFFIRVLVWPLLTGFWQVLSKRVLLGELIVRFGVV